MDPTGGSSIRKEHAVSIQGRAWILSDPVTDPGGPGYPHSSEPLVVPGLWEDTSSTIGYTVLSRSWGSHRCILRYPNRCILGNSGKELWNPGQSVLPCFTISDLG